MGRILWVVAAAAVVTTIAQAEAAPSSVAEVAVYEGSDRRKVLDDGAHREGSILICTTGTQADPLYEAFGKKYPFLKVEAYKGGTAAVARRMVEEYGVGVSTCDVIDLEIEGLRAIMEGAMLQAYRSPEQAQYPREAVEPASHWTIDYQSFVGLGYNTNLVSPNEAPKTYDDLLDPKWRGKMAVPASSTLANWIGAMVLDKGEAWVRRLADQKIRAYEVTGRAVANLVVSGEVPLSPAIFNSHIANSLEKGAPVAWRPLGGVYTSTGAAALAARAPHPHAAMLFIDYILSREGQTLYSKLGYASARTDMAAKDKPEKIYYFGNAIEYPQNYEKWMALGRQIVSK